MDCAHIYVHSRAIIPPRAYEKQRDRVATTQKKTMRAERFHNYNWDFHDCFATCQEHRGLPPPLSCSSCSGPLVVTDATCRLQPHYSSVAGRDGVQNRGMPSGEGARYRISPSHHFRAMHYTPSITLTDVEQTGRVDATKPVMRISAHPKLFNIAL